MGAGIDLVVGNLSFPNGFAGLGIQCKHEAVVTGVDDQILKDGDVAVVAAITTCIVIEVFRMVTTVFPDQVASEGIDSLNHIGILRNVEHAIIGQRRNFRSTASQVPGPHHLQLIHIVTIDFGQWAIAPAVESATPHQPVAGSRILQHSVGNRWKAVGPLAVTK